MKRNYLILMMSIVAFTVSAQTRVVKSLNFGWKFHEGDVAGAAAPQYDDQSWRSVDLPHDFQIEQPWVAPGADEKADNSDVGANIKSRLSSRGFKEMGKGWYRRELPLTDDLRGRRLLLDFEGIMYVGDVYLNGKRIGGTDYGYVGFGIDITKEVKWGEKNILAVMADTREPNNSRWYTGGGLFRDVHLIATDPILYFSRHPLYITTEVTGITSPTTAEQATIHFQIENACYLKDNPETVAVGLRIMDMNGKVVVDQREDVRRNRKLRIQEMSLSPVTIPSPTLWDCDAARPALYTAELTLYGADGQATDCVRQRFGIRQVEFGPEYGMKLNGRKVLLKGIANHHTLGALGAAAYPRAIEKRLQLLKDYGFNHVRTSHNPYSESLLDLCDEYGILVVDELYDKWLDQYCGGRAPWLNLWQHDIPEWIKRDRNHPSVVLWSLGNELQTYTNLPFNDWGVTPYRMQKELLHRYDTTRLVTVAMHPRGRDHYTDSLPAPLAKVTDIQAYNYRYMYFPGDGRRFPWMNFYQSEASIAAMGSNYFEMNLDKVIGLAYWGAIDYLGESQGWPAKGWAQGIFDISLEPKPKAYFLRSYFKPEEPLVHIGIIDSKGDIMWNGIQTGNDGMSDHWNRADGDELSLYTYTNADEVELKVNGRSLGKKHNPVDDPKHRNQIRWEQVKYEPGYIEAVGYRDGREVCRHRIETTGEAVKLKLTADNSSWQADGTDLQHIRVEAVDKKGRRVKSAQNELQFSVEGDARIVAVSSGDHNSDELNVTDHRRLYNGSAVVILRAGKKGGDVILNISPNTSPQPSPKGREPQLKKGSLKMKLIPLPSTP
ncbi:MAG: DUF4982 domain-containing protein [Prevotella sp.]|nr:DUF4982 domain-containing protein [Prevotella sp.]